MRKKRAKLGHNWLRGLIILVAAVVVAAIAVSKLTPMPAAELPDDAVIAEVTVTQGVDGVVTAYQAVTTDGESTQVDRGVFEQWLSHGAGKIDAADIENKPIPPNESTYWLFLFFFILALWCAVLGIQDMVPGLCGQARTAHWRKVMIGIGIAATVLGVIALIGQPCVHDGQISQEVKHRLPVSGTVKTKWAQITGYGKHERTIYLLSLWYPLGNTEIKAVQTVGASTYEHLKAGQTIQVVPLENQNQVFWLVPPAGRNVVVDWLAGKASDLLLLLPLALIWGWNIIIPWLKRRRAKL